MCLIDVLLVVAIGTMPIKLRVKTQLALTMYHSESGWQTLLEIIVEHYGLQVDQSAITVFVCLIPVVIDACVKLW
ncbi:hypothetical protein Goshw_002986, partial [Gossypium schwendimanii]|nr:hypothetical protein [Gossypium gossypioides]MBA0864447.1 hypothetical protein [Gossypium schwendimanii]